MRSYNACNQPPPLIWASPWRVLLAAATAVAVVVGSLVFVPEPVDAHYAPKTVDTFSKKCWYEIRWIPPKRTPRGRIAGKWARQEICERIPTTITRNRRHWHITDIQCRWVSTATSITGVYVGAAISGPAGGLIGGSVGGAVGYTVCKKLPQVIWLESS